MASTVRIGTCGSALLSPHGRAVSQWGTREGSLRLPTSFPGQLVNKLTAGRPSSGPLQAGLQGLAAARCPAQPNGTCGHPSTEVQEPALWERQGFKPSLVPAGAQRPVHSVSRCP